MSNAHDLALAVERAGVHIALREALARDRDDGPAGILGDAQAQLAEAMDVIPFPESQVLVLRVEHSDPQMAIAIVNAAATMLMSATLKIGQLGSSRKSIT